MRGRQSNTRSLDHRFGEICDQGAQFLVEVDDGQRRNAKHRISEQPDGLHCHADASSTAAITSSLTSKLAQTFCTSSESSSASMRLKTLLAPDASSSTCTLGTKDASADS